MVETRTKLVLKFKMCFLFKFDKNLIKVWPHYGKERFCDLLSILTLFQSEILFFVALKSEIKLTCLMKPVTVKQRVNRAAQ
jgi:hypothetical protein